MEGCESPRISSWLEDPPAPAAAVDAAPAARPRPQPRAPFGRAARVVPRADQRLVLVVVGGFVATALTVIATARSTVIADPLTTAMIRGVHVASWLGVGVVTLHRRPASRLGRLMLVAGAVLAGSTLMAIADPWAFLTGRLLLASALVLVLLAFLAFPTGRVEDAASRRLLWVTATGTVLVWTLLALRDHPLPGGGVTARCAGACPANPLGVVPLDAAGPVLQAIARASGAAVLLALASVMLLRYWRGSAASRHTLALPASCVAVAGVVMAVCTVLDADARPGDAPSAAAWLAVATWTALPYAFLLGQSRGRLFGADALHQAMRELAPHEHRRDVRDVLADALGDPGLELCYWVPTINGFVDRAGRAVHLDRVAPRAATSVEVEGEPVAAILHDPGLDASPGLVEAVGNAALLALENGRLEAELRSSIEELRASRARLMTVGIDERRRLERDLHDSAQNRLVALRIRLGLARERAAELDPELTAMIDALADDAQDALESIRRVARGIYPPLLISGGLVDALDAELGAAAVRVRLIAIDEVGRSTPEAEVAVYFACWEAVQNAAKHAGSGTAVTIRLRRQDDILVFSIYDDGRGFDSRTTPEGFGRTAMRDRVGGVGGTLEVHSSPGHGTLVHGRVRWPPRKPLV